MFVVTGHARINGISFRVDKRTYRITRRDTHYRVTRIPLSKIVWVLQCALVVYLIYFKFKFLFKGLKVLCLPIIKFCIPIMHTHYTAVEYIYALNYNIMVVICYTTILQLILGFFTDVHRYHWIEHAIIECYDKDLKKVTFDQVKNQSPFSKACGSTYIAVVLFTSLTGIAFHYFAKPRIGDETLFAIAYVATLFISFRLFIFLRKKTKLMTVLQIFVLKKPTDEMIAKSVIAFNQIIDTEESR